MASFALIVIIGLIVAIMLSTTNISNYRTIGDIHSPIGYTKIEAGTNSFATYARVLPLKSRGAKVYLKKSGKLFKYHRAAYAVLDFPCISEDCADVCIHLYADYLFQQALYSKICFTDINGQKLKYNSGASKTAFKTYLTNVFNRCSTFSLDRSLPIRDIANIELGDILVFLPKGGKMGHAMIVADVAVSKKGKKAFLLVQGNFPGVTMHLMCNPNLLYGAWFYTDDLEKALSWGIHPFNSTHLRTFDTD